ncbi:GntR family transcriptional regulator [Microbacterium sp.]|uniref:GntR family transcriptional regulator n=1 Tax=Microbacterium sp. TaxID=51671 RepID=UPI003221D70C
MDSERRKAAFVSPILRSSIRDTVTAALRSAIISGEMVPGQVYSAPTLSEQFGVSATPVRESMLDLAKEGLVEPVPNKGFRVTEITSRDLDDVAKIRLLLEPPSIREITPIVPAGDLADLRRLADETVDAARTGDLVTFLDSDRTLHLRLLGYTRNAMLTELVSDLRNRTRLFGLRQLADAGVLDRSAQEHHDLLDAIEARDAVRAETVMITHIDHVRLDWSGSDAQPA